jgi:hypothetical protein
MKHKHTVTIHDPERAAFWQASIGTTTLPVISPFPTYADVPGHPHALVYMLNLRAIDSEMRAKIIGAIARQFHYSERFVADHIDEGMPILAEGCSVISTDLGLVLSAMEGLTQPPDQ